MAYIRMDPDKAATLLLSKSMIKRSSKVALVGSNYQMFKKFKEDPDCAKCADSYAFAEPKPVDVFTFEVSLIERRILLANGVAASAILMPADFMKGADSVRLKMLRESYCIPEPYLSLLDRYDIPKEEQQVVFESRFKSRAKDILKKKILRRKERMPFAISEEELEDDTATIIATGEIGMFQRIPLGRRVFAVDGKRFAIPFCQVICCAIYEEIRRQGFTDLLWMHNEAEMVCLNQGTTIAQILGFLKMNVLAAIFREADGGFELTDLREYLAK